MEIRARLKHERLAQEIRRGKLSQNRWAQKLGINRGHLSQLVRGRRPFPKAETRARLLEGLNLSFDDLFEYVPYPTDPARSSHSRLTAQPSPNAGRVPPRAPDSARIGLESRAASLIKDCREACRRLAAKPGYSLVALLTLAIGIGASSAIYTLLSNTLLAPLPFQDPQRLVLIWSHARDQQWLRGSVSIPEVEDQRRQNPALQQIGVFNHRRSLSVSSREGAVRLDTVWTDSAYFRALGVEAALGRTFSPQEDREPGAHPVAILSHSFWKDRFASDPDVLGAEIRLTGRTYEVIGVMPSDFRDPTQAQGNNPQVWVPLSMGMPFFGASMYQTRSNRQYAGLARLAPGYTLQQARQASDSIAARLETQFPDTHSDRGIRLEPLYEYFYRDLERPLQALMAAALLVLLLGCVNVATLLLVRARARRGELALRAALGASSSRLMRETLLESLLLSAAGGAAGLILAWGAVRAVASFGTLQLPSFAHLHLDWEVLGLSLALSLATGLLFGALPALHASRTDPGRVLHSAGRSLIAGGGVLRWLVTAEAALAVVLLIGAGLTARSLFRLVETEMGFDTGRLLTMRTELRGPRFSGRESIHAFARDLLQDVRALPGVESAAVWGPSMVGNANWHMNVTPAGLDPQDPRNWTFVQRLMVSPGALESLRIPLLRGRSFRADDRDSAQDLNRDGTITPDEVKGLVVMVDQRLADILWPGQEALGKRLQLWAAGGWPATVVGVTQPVLHRGRNYSGSLGDLYLPFFEFSLRDMTLLVRYRSNANATLEAVRRIVRRLDAEVPLYDAATMQERLAVQEAQPRFVAALMAAYAGTATFLAAVGIFGVLTYWVRRSRDELAVRSALGARRNQLILLTLRKGLTPVLLGGLIGIASAMGLSGFVESLLFEISRADAATYVLAAALLAAVALASCLLPARRAGRMDPMEVLRGE